MLDVGAHRGEFASAVRALLPTVAIYAFEPQPAECRSLHRRLGRGTGLRTFAVALGDRGGVATFYRDDFTKASSLLRMTDRHRQAFPWTGAGECFEVRVVRLDALAGELELRRPVLLKVDVQGSELAVLAGAGGLLDRVDLVLVETSMTPLYEGGATFGAVHAHLEQRGFRYAGSVDQLCDPRSGEVLQQDSLFVRNDAES